MIRPALSLIASVMLIGCGSDSDNTPRPDISTMDEISVRKIGIDLINITDQSIDFYIKENNDNIELFDDGNKVATTLSDDTSYHGISWTSPSPMEINVGISDTNSQTTQAESDDIILNDKEKLWAIAWDDGDDITLSTNTEQPSPIEDKYRIRIFTISDTWVQIISSAISTMEVKAGKFSPHMTIENCSGELYLSANSVDICDLDIGKSYLLIIDGEDLLLAAEEK
ncbi:hypothetical protein [Photobacterium aquae]|nr:hypothetical protein [Photobacterium aquae]